MNSFNIIMHRPDGTSKVVRRRVSVSFGHHIRRKLQEKFPAFKFELL